MNVAHVPRRPDPQVKPATKTAKVENPTSLKPQSSPMDNVHGDEMLAEFQKIIYGLNDKFEKPGAVEQPAAEEEPGAAKSVADGMR